MESLSLIAHCFLSGKQKRAVAWNHCWRTGEVSLGYKKNGGALSGVGGLSLEIQNLRVPFNLLLLHLLLNL